MSLFSCVTLCLLVPLICTIEANSNEKSETKKKPHILLIVADDLGFNDVPWHNEEVIAPNLKDLANNGIILEQSYVQPICTPTRAALMTGNYPFTIGRQDNIIAPLTPTGLTLDSVIIPQLLKPLGYSTHAVGKWHLGFCKWDYTPTERGFDTFLGFYNGGEKYYSHDKSFCKGKMTGYDFRNNRDVDYNANGTYSTNVFSSHVKNLLHSSNSTIPKFIYLAFQSVHAPLQVPKKFKIPYKHIKNRDRRTYLGMVSAMDEAIGRIVKALKDTDHYKDTVIIFTTDNGGSTINGGNNWPLRGSKKTQWEGGTRGAAFVHSPQLPNPGTVSRNLIHVTDWMSTIVNLAGGLPPTNTDSLDQWPSLVGQSSAPRNEFIYDMVEDTEFFAAIRVGDFKLLVGNPGSGDWTSPPELEKKISSRSTNDKEEKTDEIVGEFYDKNKIYNVSLALLDSSDVRLYNIKVDPEERHDLHHLNRDIVENLFNKILSYKRRFVKADHPPHELNGSPKFWEGIWSPGWC